MENANASYTASEHRFAILLLAHSQTAAPGTTEPAVNDAALAAARTTLDAAVAGGSVTQAQADEIYAQPQERGPLTIGRGGRHGDREAPAGEATPAPTAATPEA